MEAIWRFDTITLYWQLEQMAKRDCVEIRERCKRQLSQEGRDAHIITDSGNVAEEATFLGIPFLGNRQG